MVHRTDDPQARFLLDVMDAQALFDLLHTVPDIETAGLVGVCFIPDGLLDLVRDVADIAGGLVVDGGIHRTAVGVAQHHHQPTAQMAGRVLDAAQLVVIDDVARQPDDEQLTDARREDVLRDDPGIRTGDDDGVGRLALRLGGHPDTAGNIAAPVFRVQVFQIARRQLVDGIGRGADWGLTHCSSLLGEKW